MKKYILVLLSIFSLSIYAYDPGAVNLNNLIDVQMNNWRMISSSSSKQFGGRGAYNSSSTGQKFHCFGSETAGTDSTIAVSYQGQKSFVGTTPSNSQVRGTSYNPNSNTFFAFGTVSPGSTGFVLYGTDCVSWSTGTWSGTGFGRAGASSPTMNVIVGGNGSGCSISYSAAGVTWTASTITSSGCGGSVGELFNVVWTGTKFVATGFEIYGTSTDGITWTIGNLPTGTWKGLVWDGSKLITVKGASDSQFAVSTDGITWTVQSQVHSIGGCQAGSFIWTGKIYFCGTLNLTGKNAAYSTDLFNWKTIALPVGSLAGVSTDGIRIIGVNSAPVTATDTFIISNGLF